MSTLKKTRRTLLIMVAVFAVPYVLAWFLYFNPEVIGLNTRNHGTLISPVIVSNEFTLKQADGLAYVAEKDSNQWMLISFGTSECDQECQKTLFTLQQLRKMLGVDKAQLRRAYVVLESAMLGAVPSGLEGFEGTELLLADPTQTSGLEKKLGIEPGQLDQYIVIADPAGNLVMMYPRDMDPKKIFADIEILFGRVKRV